ncbi:MAG: N-acetylmuramoyl-L-alanine amidase, partial [Thermoanaerobacteraceae bacterium]|nr:N-acetylmuramoyl-L-alanine amidase [Thermoanaerobacteraceae bacterium]
MERLYPRFIIIHHTAGFDVPALTIDSYHAKEGFGVKITSPKSLVDEYIR